MKDTRPGESLWIPWSGYGYEQENEHTLVYVTYAHVDLENEIVRRALASSLQRDGICDSLSDGFEAVASGAYRHGWVGLIDEDVEFTACEDNGETKLGDNVDSINPATWFEVAI